MTALACCGAVRYYWCHMLSALETVQSGFIVASPALQDPNFDHAVILMCMHGDQGAMGLVINRPAPVTTREFMEQIGIAWQQPRTGAVLIGGPVGIDSGVLVYQTDEHTRSRSDDLVISDALRMCPNQDILDEIGAGHGPERFHIFLGHAGWAPGQLEQEIAQGVWVPARLDLRVIFDTPAEDRWEAALSAEGLHPAMLGAFRPQN